LQTSAEDHDAKARREDVLNQLLVLLNTAVAENKEIRAMEALGKVQAGRPASGTPDRGRHQRQDSIEYQHGSLGLVPMS
jgi:hypothetical protein